MRLDFRTWIEAWQKDCFDTLKHPPMASAGVFLGPVIHG